MKKIITLIIFLFISISINAQCGIGYKYDFKNFTDLEKRDLKGKIEIVNFSHYEVNNSFGEISKGEKKCEQLVLFNMDGTVKKIIQYDSKGEIENIDIHEFENSQIRLISHFDNKGILISKTAFINEGKDIREQLFLADGNLNDQYFIRSYDLNGNMVKVTWKYHEEPRKSDVTQYYYDKNNRVIKYIRDKDDLFIITYKDNFSKFPIKIERPDPITKKMKIDESFEYNSQGSIIKEYDNGKLSRSYDYIYDNKKNWIKKLVFKTEAKIPYEIIERKINYFE
jgi:hypothetical protein